jgi:hypothetical protein
MVQAGSELGDSLRKITLAFCLASDSFASCVSSSALAARGRLSGRRVIIVDRVMLPNPLVVDGEASKRRLQWYRPVLAQLVRMMDRVAAVECPRGCARAAALKRRIDSEKNAATDAALLRTTTPTQAWLLVHPH